MTCGVGELGTEGSEPGLGERRERTAVAAQRLEDVDAHGPAEEHGTGDRVELRELDLALVHLDPAGEALAVGLEHALVLVGREGLRGLRVAARTERELQERLSAVVQLTERPEPDQALAVLDDHVPDHTLALHEGGVGLLDQDGEVDRPVGEDLLLEDHLEVAAVQAREGDRDLVPVEREVDAPELVALALAPHRVVVLVVADGDLEHLVVADLDILLREGSNDGRPGTGRGNLKHIRAHDGHSLRSLL